MRQIDNIIYQQDERFARLGHIHPQVRYQLWTFAQGPFDEHPLNITNFSEYQFWCEYFIGMIMGNAEEDYRLEMIEDWINKPAPKWRAYLERIASVES